MSWTQTKRAMRRWLPAVGTVFLLAYLAWSADLKAVSAAFASADLGSAIAVLTLATLVTWAYDSACLAWLVGRTLGHRGEPGGGTLRELMPLKAASYVLNIVNYNAATLGMAWVVSRRKGVSFLESAAALAVLSYVDLVALAGLVVAGLALAPEVLGGEAELVGRLHIVVVAIFSAAVFLLLALQSPLRLGFLDRLRDISVLRPLAALKPLDMVVGVTMRAGFVLLYVGANYLLMQTFGMTPRIGALLVLVPVLTVVGVVPLSVSGIGTTQILMRTLYAPFVADGRAAGPVIDAWSTAMIFGFIAVRLVVAAPFLPKVLAELRHRPKAD
ncbi:MAG: flippase-like domain-containing protein [Myxococcales bacterium]|nr:flippase-like domain-containing protein [Myxococcales bacterium]